MVWCEYKTSLESEFKTHIEEHHDETQRMMRERRTCEECGFRSTSDYVLDKHMSMNHQIKRKGTTSKRRQCEDCGKKFNKDSTLEHHMRTMHSEETQSQVRTSRARK